MAFRFVFLGNYIFISDQNVITEGIRNRICIFFIPLGIQTLHFWCGQKPGKHAKPRKIREFEKLSKFHWNSGKLEFLWIKTWKTRGKSKICDINVNKNVFQQTFLSRVTQGKV